MLKRLKPSATEWSTKYPAESGPRWTSLSVMRDNSSLSGLRSSRVSTKPTRPHITINKRSVERGQLCQKLALLCATSAFSASLRLTKFTAITHRRDAENAEVAQRNQKIGYSL